MPSKTKPAYLAGFVGVFNLLGIGMNRALWFASCAIRLLALVGISFVDHLATIAAGNPEHQAVGSCVVSSGSSKKAISRMVTHGLVLSFRWDQLKICYASYQCAPGWAAGIGAGWRKAVRFGGELLEGGPLFGGEFQ